MNPEDYNDLEELDNPLDLVDLSGKVGLIAGGAGKMGQTFSTFLCKAGAKVIVADIDLDSKKYSKSVKTGKGQIIGIKCDITSEKEIIDLLDKIDTDFGQLDFLISNVMSKPEGYYDSFESYSKKVWNRVMEANLYGTFSLCQKATELMRNGGSIVLTSSIYGVVGPHYEIYNDGESKNKYDKNRNLTTPHSYSASKGALLSLCRSLSTELAPKNIRVNSLVPGGVFDDQEASFHDKYVSHTPLGRMATWTDYNGAIIFLVSDYSRYMTGSSLVIDGGWTAW